MQKQVGFFPGAGYKQKENKMSDLENKFVEFGARLGVKMGNLVAILNAVEYKDK